MKRGTTLNWFELYKHDVQRYVKYRKDTTLPVIFFTEQGLWALFQYRLASALYRSSLPWGVKRLLLYGMAAWQKLVEVLTGISLPYEATIGAGLFIGHFGTIIINPKVVIGENCNVSQGVTIGVSGRKANRGVPVIGDRVYIGTNAVVAGKLTIGDDVVIAANSLVTRDVPAHTTVMGVPAQVVSQAGSEYYLDPEGQSNEAELKPV